jgi:phage gp36-like protein
MPYATATQLLTRFSANEIAQRADRGEVRLVTAQLMTDAAAGTSLAGYTAGEQAAAPKALAVVQRALDDARNTIDSHIGGRYSLPIAPVPEILERLACDLARFYLYDDLVTEAIQKRFDDAMKLLRDVRDGKSQLGPHGTTNQQPVSNAGAELETGARVWRRKDSTGFL